MARLEAKLDAALSRTSSAANPGPNPGSNPGPGPGPGPDARAGARTSTSTPARDSAGASAPPTAAEIKIRALSAARAYFTSHWGTARYLTFAENEVVLGFVVDAALRGEVTEAQLAAKVRGRPGGGAGPWAV